MTPKKKFAEGEKVLCFQGPLIYEAKALKSMITKDKQIKYYVHYAGWNKNWDEWVPENRVLKYNDVNVQKQKEVVSQHPSAAGKGKKAAPKRKKSGASSGGSESRVSKLSKDLSLAATSSTIRSNRAKQISATGPATSATKENEASIVTTMTTEDEAQKDENSKDETSSY